MIDCLTQTVSFLTVLVSSCICLIITSHLLLCCSGVEFWFEMADASGSGFEAEPLKGGEAEGGVAKKKSRTEKLGFSHLTGWRTAAFLLSLFLCLVVVFAFSFILPCPVRPQYLSTWNRTLPDAGEQRVKYSTYIHAFLIWDWQCFSPVATYDFLAVEDTNEDKVLDVLFIYKDSEASRNTCLSGSKPHVLTRMLLFIESKRNV